jgi:hypothetical protein
MMVGELMRLKHWWNDMNRKTKVLEQKCDMVPLCIINPTWTGLRINAIAMRGSV